MGTATAIEWCDHTASPWHGCTKIAAGCENCYAARQAVRNPGTLGIWGDDGVRVKSKSFIKNLERWNAEAKKAGRIVSVFPSICDPFEDRPELEPWRQEMFDAARRLPFIRLLLLTKRPDNVWPMWPLPLGTTEPVGISDKVNQISNVWIGTSVATQADADRNIPWLLKCRELSPVLFVSAEPLLEKVDFRRIAVPDTSLSPGDYNYPAWHLWDSLTGFCGNNGGGWMSGRRINWVIIGGESGPNARPCDLSWLRSLRNQCRSAGVPPFIKQAGSHVIGSENERYEMCGICIDRKPGTDSIVRWKLRDSKGGDPAEWPEDLRVREFPAAKEPA